MAADYGPFGDTAPNTFDGTLPASTGKNDSSSVWGSGWVSGISTLTNSAGGILTALNGGNKNKKATTGLPAWSYLALGGVVLLLVVGLVFRRR